MTGRRAAPYLLEFTLDKICKASSIRSYAALWKYNATLYGKYVCTYLSLCIGNRLQAVFHFDRRISSARTSSSRKSQIRKHFSTDACTHSRVYALPTIPRRNRFSRFAENEPESGWSPTLSVVASMSIDGTAAAIEISSARPVSLIRFVAKEFWFLCMQRVMPIVQCGMFRVTTRPPIVNLILERIWIPRMFYQISMQWMGPIVLSFFIRIP